MSLMMSENCTMKKIIGMDSAVKRHRIRESTTGTIHVYTLSKSMVTNVFPPDRMVK